MKKENTKLMILFDGLLKGGAETLLLGMLPSFKKSYKKIDIYLLTNQRPFSTDFGKYARLQRISITRLFILLLRTRTSLFYVNLSKSIFLINVFIFIFGNRGNKFFCHEHTSQEFFSQQRGFKKLLGFLYLFLVRKNINKSLMYYIVSSKGDIILSNLEQMKEILFYFPILLQKIKSTKFLT